MVLVVRVDDGPIVGVAIVYEMSAAPFEVQAQDIPRVWYSLGMDMRAKQHRLEMLLMAQNRVHRRNVEGPHYHDISVGVEPLQQGRGLARLILRSIIAMAQGRGLPIYLETQGPRNVGIFNRFGYDVVEQCRPNADSDDTFLPDVFAMLHQAPKRPSDMPTSSPP